MVYGKKTARSREEENGARRVFGEIDGREIEGN
jgi:hypothetical protein